jgi:oxygen-independent coproporphyrinogen-3 oxidase
MNPFSVYVHVPYCARKCPYCDFNVHVVRTIPEERYRDALLAEIDARAMQAAWQDRNIATVFFGGGTPSLFAAATYAALLSRLEDRFGIASGAEISWEANPEDLVDPATDLADLRAAGITRISLGAQSFDDGVLRLLGRLHEAGDVANAIIKARAAGFDDIGIDLIFAVPGQSLEQWRSDLQRAVDLRPSHVSTYGLTYEEGTSLTRRRVSGRIMPADEELECAMYETAVDTLEAAGFRHYEISNFARPGYESRHNITYWSWGDYLGIGAGAHGFARRPPPVGTDDWGSRYENARAPEEYMRSAPCPETWSEILDRRTAMEEFILLGLRRREGFDEGMFEGVFGAALAQTAPALQRLVATGLLALDAGRVMLTRKGLLLADTVTAQLADLRP